ncbi:MAG: phosphoenolpyruvate synthase/pyruvate phosphate dikinase [Bacteriovoracaceae bacterium]|nr:phosphoenolpyruvate synthase/pyruvate phosphate dikinase [Bacteriovoracaceae bacterium]
MVVRYKTYQRLMAHRVREILIISSPYDAFIMEEDGGLIEHVFMKFRGISLVEPPRFSVVPTATEALAMLKKHSFDLVVTMPRLLRMDTITFGREIKKIRPECPVVLLVQNAKGLVQFPRVMPPDSIDKMFLWSGDRNILWTILKWHEDRMNAPYDTKDAMVRVLILIEDSPYYYSSILPILYKAIVDQTQDVMDDSLNEEHRLLKLRARTKILLANNYEEAMALYNKYRPYLLGIFSDTRFPRGGKEDAEAGLKFLKLVGDELPDLPLLLLSSEDSNYEKSQFLRVKFLHKNSHSLHLDIKKFLVRHMGFGDFVFKMPNGREVARATNLGDLEKILETVPKESLMYHLAQNHFSNWFLARGETSLATHFRVQKYSAYSSMELIRSSLMRVLTNKRISRLRGEVLAFNPLEFDLESAFMKMGDGSLGGKARGLAFMSKFLQRNMKRFDKFKNMKVTIPRTLVLTTDIYDQFIEENDLLTFSHDVCDNEVIARRFVEASTPERLIENLRPFIKEVKFPLAVRSSSLLEDSRDDPYAGIYTTYMLPNNHPSDDERLNKLTTAIKLVFASIFFEGSKAYSKSTQHRVEEEKMAVIIQQVIGNRHGNYFYPDISGTAQSHNFYPLAHMRSNEGIANISMGLGKIVVEGGETLRFSPKYPQNLAQFSSVDDMLSNAQKHFYAIKMDSEPNTDQLCIGEEANLEKRDVFDARSEKPLQMLASTYMSNDHVVRDYFSKDGLPILTFASILKYQKIPLPEVLATMIKICKDGFGSDLELEFAVNLSSDLENEVHEFALLQARPMTTQYENLHVNISKKDKEKAICFSTSALGRGVNCEMQDIIFVKPDTFSSLHTLQIASEISKYNAELLRENRKFLLVGPGRWGSSDHCLGVPVSWHDISGVGAIIEAATDNFRVDPSQGTHFFQNLTSLRISYMTIYGPGDFIHWDWFESLDFIKETNFTRHIRTNSPITIKINGKKNHGVLQI